MLLSQALDTVHKFTPQEFSTLADLLSPELIDQCLADSKESGHETEHTLMAPACCLGCRCYKKTCYTG